MSTRAAGLQPFLVMEVLERAQELERQGRPIIHLEVGEPDFATPRAVCEAAHAALDAGLTHYTHSMGTLRLREAIAARYARLHGVEISPDRVLVTGGSSLAMLYAFGAMVEPGDEVIAATPHYPCYPNFIRFFGGRMVEVPTDPHDGYRLDPDAVRSAITPRTRLILLNSPSNPTGAVLEPDRMRALCELGLPIVSDEIYHGLTYGEPATTALRFRPDAVVVDGFSKRYAMTGWRLGYLIAPSFMMRTFQTMQQNLFISPNAFVQEAAMAALEEGDDDTARMRETYGRRRDLMVGLFRELGFAIPAMPQGAFYVLADASRYTDDSLAFAFELLECANVAVAPGVDFGEAARRAIRLCYAASDDAIREAANRVREYLACRG